jgi:membrane fusion protein (multidrug efflux system)
MSQSSNAGQKGKTVAVVLLTAGVVVLVVLLVWFIHFRIRYAVSDAVFIRTDSLATLGFDRVSGRILKMEKKEGDPVQKDEIIARIDDVPYRLEAKRLESEIRATHKKQEEQELLFERLEKETALRRFTRQRSYPNKKLKTSAPGFLFRMPKKKRLLKMARPLKHP